MRSNAVTVPSEVAAKHHKHTKFGRYLSDQPFLSFIKK